MSQIYTSVYMNMWNTLINLLVGSEDINKTTKCMKQTVTKMHLKFEFVSN